MLLNTSILLPQLFCNVEFEFSWFHNTKIHQKFWFWKYIINDFGFSLDSSDVDLWNIDLLDTDIPSKHFVCLQKKIHLPRRPEDAFKTSLQEVFKMPWKTKNSYAEDVLKTNKCLLGYFHYQVYALMNSFVFFFVFYEVTRYVRYQT